MACKDCVIDLNGTGEGPAKLRDSRTTGLIAAGIAGSYKLNIVVFKRRLRFC